MNPRALVENCSVDLRSASAVGDRRYKDEGKMVAGTGIEPACVAYETTEEPLLNPASIKL